MESYNALPDLIRRPLIRRPWPQQLNSPCLPLRSSAQPPLLRSRLDRAAHNRRAVLSPLPHPWSSVSKARRSARASTSPGGKWTPQSPTCLTWITLQSVSLEQGHQCEYNSRLKFALCCELQIPVLFIPVYKFINWCCFTIWSSNRKLMKLISGVIFYLYWTMLFSAIRDCTNNFCYVMWET